jgi:F-type H+-transporting ATPase subunit gamma
MPGSKEIRNKIKSVQNTRKITKAMEMVAASKMRRAQERMRTARPYGEKIRNVAAHISHANPEYRHPFLIERDTVPRVGIIVITTDKGLCGGLNTNLLRLALTKIRELQAAGEEIEVCAIGNKGFGFMQRLGAKVASHVTGLGDRPHMEKLIGAVKVMLDGYIEDRFDRLMIFYTKFINTMKQEPVMERLLPLAGERLPPARQPRGQLGLPLRARRESRAGAGAHALHRGADLPGGCREHGLGTVGSDGGDEGRLRQRRQRDRRADAGVQQDAPGFDHQGARGDRGRRSGGLRRERTNSN